MPDARFLPTPPMAAAGVAVAFFQADQVRADRVFQVIGAPGTGKTSALLEYHATLAQDIRPEQILVLAATRDSAASLRDRLLLQLGKKLGTGSSDSAYAVEGALARTVSSLAFAVVRQHALANDQREPELISGAQQDAIFAELIAAHQVTPFEGKLADEIWPSHITQVTRGLAGFRTELRDLIASCQEFDVSAENLAELGRGEVAPKRTEWLAAASLYKQYELLLATPEYSHRFDAPSLVNRAIQLIASADAAGSGLAHDFKVVLVDDAQELTPSAQRLLLQLTRHGAGLVLFGDPDASTLGFRQADPRIMSNLVAQVATDRGAKSQDLILEVDRWGKPAGFGRAMGKVASLISAQAAGRQRIVHSVSMASEQDGGLVAKVFATQQDEIEWLAFNLRKLHLESQVAWSEMAVVARTRQQLDQLERALSAESVPVRIQGAQHALRDEFASRELRELAAACYADAEIDAAAVERMIRSPYCGLDSVAVRRLRRQLRRQELEGIGDGQLGRNSDELLLELFRNSDAAATLRGADAAKVRRFLKSLEKAKKLAADPLATIEDLLWQLWDDSGMAERWTELSRGVGEIAVQSNRNLDAIVALFAAANRFVERNPGRDKALFLEAQLKQRLPEDSLTFGRKAEQFVNLLTPAGLVGRRFQIVAIPQLIEGIWPNLKPRNSLLNAGLLAATLTGRLSESGGPVRAEMADELRMFYKAVGSANARCFVSSYSSEDEQVSQFLAHAAGSGIPAEESFELSSFTLRGMAGDLRKKLVREKSPAMRAKYAVDLARLAAAGVPGAHPDDWYGLDALSTNEPLFDFITEEQAALEQQRIEAGQEAEGFADDRGVHIGLNPSQLDAFVTCPLHWFLNYHGGSQSDYSASVGTLIHHAMEVSTAVDEENLWAEVESGWHTLRFESAWLEQAARREAQKAVANLSAYLTKFDAQGGRLVGAETEFSMVLGKAQIRGKVDRIELSPDGNVVIVDLKTGSSKPSVADTQDNPQLGLYQLAFQGGAFEDLKRVEGAQLGGAKLLLVADSLTLRDQQSLAENPERQKYFERLVQSAAEGMAMPERVFIANVGSHCTADNSYGSCQLHLTKAVSHVA